MYDLILDVETAPTVKYNDNKAHPETSLVYDLGGVVRDTKNGVIVDSFSFVIAEVFYNNNLMKSAYYADKLPQYHNGIKTNDWMVVPFKYAYDYIRDIIKKYNIKHVWAYNANFDRIALNFTIKTMSNGWQNYFFPYKIKVKDIWARCTNITGTKKYVKWCIKNNYITSSGNPQTGAEIVYRYINNDSNFIEAHTAMQDAIIESIILTTSQKNHSKSDVKKNLGCGGWRPAKNIKDKL